MPRYDKPRRFPTSPSVVIPHAITPILVEGSVNENFLTIYSLLKMLLSPVYVLNKTLIEQHKQRMLNFLQEAYDERLQSFFDLTDDLLKIGKNIGERMKIDYVDLDKDSSIDKIKLIIITNKKLFVFHYILLNILKTHYHQF